jgi:uncharacterized hydrophobic protein (TIGR00271 family)
MPRVTGADLLRMRDQLFYEGPERSHRLTKFWSLLLLSAVIASAGVIGDSTATVIGAMIVAPLMTPILGIVLAIVLTDAKNLRRSIALVVAGGASVVAVAWIMGHFLEYGVTAATNSQVAQRVSPRLIDLVAALATGAVGAVALAREDISDTLPGVAIAISLVPPLAVVGLTLEAGVPDQAAGALVLFATNVCAILGSGIVVMRIYGVARSEDDLVRPTFRRGSATAIVIALVALVALPLGANSVRLDQTTARDQQIRSVAETWADQGGWAVVAVTSRRGTVWIQATGPAPAPSTARLRDQLRAAGFGRVPVKLDLDPAVYSDLPP